MLEDQTSRGQLIKLPEDEAKARYPNLVIASLGANRKDKPNGEISACVLFDGTNGLQVNTRTRLRDQERSPIAADLNRAMREKTTMGVRTFALTADVKEAHRQAGADPPSGLAPPGVEAEADVYINTVGTFGTRAGLKSFFLPPNLGQPPIVILNWLPLLLCQSPLGTGLSLVCIMLLSLLLARPEHAQSTLPICSMSRAGFMPTRSTLHCLHCFAGSPQALCPLRPDGLLGHGSAGNVRRMASRVPSRWVSSFVLPTPSGW